MAKRCSKATTNEFCAFCCTLFSTLCDRNNVRVCGKSVAARGGKSMPYPHEDKHGTANALKHVANKLQQLFKQQPQFGVAAAQPHKCMYVCIYEQQCVKRKACI